MSKSAYVASAVSVPRTSARALLSIGITQIAQVAALTPQDIVGIAPLIKAQADRILRDDWVGQAQLLLDETWEK